MDAHFKQGAAIHTMHCILSSADSDSRGQPARIATPRPTELAMAIS
jgi:hypothetical protein